MIDRIRRNPVLLVTVVFIIGLVLSVYFEFYYFSLVSVLLGAVYCAFFRIQWLLYLIFLFTPLSINTIELNIEGVGLYLPTEPLLLGLLLVMTLHLFDIRGQRIWKVSHPIYYILLVYFIWLLFTSITSEIPGISFKYLVNRAWFILPVFLLGVQLFKNPENLKRGFLLYFIPLLIVIIYTVVRHSMYGFDKDSAHWVMEPLFKDHTVYGAALALVFPISFSMLFSKKPSPFLRFVLLLGFVLLSLGLFLSYTRAAWLSVVGAVVVLLLLLLRISFRSVFFTALIVGGGLFFSWDEIQIALNRNKKESSDNIDEHLQSISNVSSDASNLERVNRWHCALAMFEERPLVGWGPGTYQFLYAPFQQPEDKTIISTNRGDGGNAHSEYLGPLAEQGVLGGMIFFTLAMSIFSLGFRVFYSSQEYESKLLILGSFLGLVTYLIHGVLNNFLDSDKVAIPFWMFVAFLVAQDFKLRENSNFQ